MNFKMFYVWYRIQLILILDIDISNLNTMKKIEAEFFSPKSIFFPYLPMD